MKTLDIQKCEYILHQNYIGHLGYIYNNRPFIVPITYLYNKDHLIIGYSGEGHKINALRLNPNVSLEVSEIDAIDKWKSVLVHGVFKELTGSGAKAMLHEFSLGIKEVILNNEGRDLDYIHEFSAKVEAGEPVIYKIEVEEITGKYRIN
ncbi:pyridoxamine 5'-phosphate oxidase family protein [Aestuariibaculum sediminum]|uniref:Pyridoxamine 5'-phosphate oxidase family protein n=1 Tax=Aestuariibaculum sediminum TaxID=2770637 RepID=A0A8J6UCH5_9FLAO|nr:pyridoxamine 5'-phosphate oxidase family protein [Aestuariibaculum sediminum]MBD0832349.1 pyridoxamine 5'-phosphate oxidase family protein [Aestuariibaculum sediminum]